MDRRTFLGTVTAATILGSRLGWAADDHKIAKVGVQLYTVRTLMKTDFDGTLAKVAEIGYKEVEFAGYFDRKPKDVRATLDKLGIASPSSHIPYEQFQNKWPEALDTAHVMGQEYLVCPAVEDNLRKTLDSWKQVAATLNKAGEAAKKAGVQVAYHNHWWEFEPIDGKRPYDLLLAETDPNLVKMEMDLFWITKAGGDPQAYFAKYPGRFPLVHVKGRAKDGSMTDVRADNSIDWKKLFADPNGGIKHYFVEFDEPKNPLESIRTSYQYLSQLTF